MLGGWGGGAICWGACQQVAGRKPPPESLVRISAQGEDYGEFFCTQGGGEQEPPPPSPSHTSPPAASSSPSPMRSASGTPDSPVPHPIPPLSSDPRSDSPVVGCPLVVCTFRDCLRIARQGRRRDFSVFFTLTIFSPLPEAVPRVFSVIPDIVI